MSRRWLIGIFSIAALLRLGWIWAAPAWYDESFTLLVSRLPFDRMLAAVAGDVHPPLWYLLVWPIVQTLHAMSLSAPIWVLRLPAALFSLAAMWIFYRIVETLQCNVPTRVRTAALVLMAVMPMQLYYAQEARMYALLEFLVLLAVLAMLQHRWWLFALAGVLMLYTQYYGVFYFLALWVVASISESNKLIRYAFNYLSNKGSYDYGFTSSGRTIILSGLLVWLSFLPWVVFVMLPQMHTLSGSYWMQLTGPGMVLRVLFETLFMPPQNAVIQIPLMLAGFGWLAVGIIYAIVGATRRVAPTTGLVFALAFLPFVFAITFSLLWQPILHYRPLIAITPFLYILLAGPVEALFASYPYTQNNPDKRFEIINLRRALLAAIFILPLLLVCDGSMYLYARQIKTPGAAAELAYIQARWQTGDIVYHYSDDSWVNSAASGLPMYKSADCGPTLGALSPATRAALGQRIARLADLEYRRAWVIWQDGPTDPACNRTQRPAGAPLLVSQDDEYVFDGLWLVEK